MRSTTTLLGAHHLGSEGMGAQCRVGRELEYGSSQTCQSKPRCGERKQTLRGLTLGFHTEEAYSPLKAFGQNHQRPGRDAGQHWRCLQDELERHRARNAVGISLEQFPGNFVPRPLSKPIRNKTVLELFYNLTDAHSFNKVCRYKPSCVRKFKHSSVESLDQPVHNKFTGRLCGLQSISWLFCLGSFLVNNSTVWIGKRFAAHLWTKWPNAFKGKCSTER